MSIAYLLGRYPTASNTFVYREIAALRQHGVSVEVYALSRTRDFNGDILGDQAIQWVPTAHGVLVADSIPHQLAREWLSHGGRAKDLRRARWLARRWRKSGVSCVHAHFLGFSAALASIACAIANIPLVVTVHARGILVPDDFSFLTLRRATSLISISEETRRVILEKSGRHSILLPVPIGEASLARPSESTFHILSVGRPVAKKGYSTLREAISSLHGSVQWTVAGATEAEVGGAMDGLNALGVVPFERIHAVYEQGVDVFALSCCEAADGDVDGIPVAILEAMVRGVAVVTTSVGGIPELITDGENGLLVPPEQPIAFADGLKTLMEDKRLRSRLAQNARSHVLASRSVRKHVQALNQHFSSLLLEAAGQT